LILYTEEHLCIKMESKDTAPVLKSETAGIREIM